jgi:hypothetical protein
MCLARVIPAAGMDGSVDRSKEGAREETSMQPRFEPVSPAAMLHVTCSQAELASQVEEETQAHVPPAQDVAGPQATTAATTVLVSE